VIEVDVAQVRGDFRLDASFRGGAGVTALFGPSGSGKSSLIALMAGLTRPDRGRIVLDGRTLVDVVARTFVPPHKRRIGLVFQDAQLFPHLSVRQNLLFGRFFSPRAERTIALGPVVETLGISGLLGRRPLSLSGGERQRVAIGRALMASPRLLLMDEPLASLDMARRLEVLPLIERLRDEFCVPIVYVSHAVEEVARLSATVVVLENGRVTAVGPPSEVLAGGPDRPGERAGGVSVLSGVVGAFDAAYAVTPLAHPGGSIVLPGRARVAVGQPARVVVRATDVTLATSRPRNLTIRTSLEGVVARVIRDDGPIALVEVRFEGGDRLMASATRLGVDEIGLAEGDRVFALVKSVALA
jgi:molybdate transport system ATP-binding protein